MMPLDVLGRTRATLTASLCGSMHAVPAAATQRECRLASVSGHLVAQDMARALHVPMGLRLLQHGPGAGLRTASHGASHSRLQSLHASILLCLVGQLVCVKAHTHPATAATSSSLGSRADPGCSRTGCIQLFSQRYREITGTTPLATMPRTGPVGSRVVSRSMRATMEQAQ